MSALQIEHCLLCTATSSLTSNLNARRALSACSMLLTIATILIFSSNAAMIAIFVQFPKNTKIYCGHEYSYKNAEFCMKYDDDNIDSNETPNNTPDNPEDNPNTPEIDQTMAEKLKASCWPVACCQSCPGKCSGENAISK